MKSSAVYLPGYKKLAAAVTPTRENDRGPSGGTEAPAAREPSVYCKCKTESALYHGCSTCVGAGMLCVTCWASHRCEGGKT